MLLSLDIRTPVGGAYSVAVGSGDIDVGRAASCAVRLPYPAVSGRHLRLVDHGGRWTVTDLGSKNGTLIDGRPLEPGQQVSVRDGTSIQIGEVQITIALDTDTSEGFSLTETGTMLRKLIAESLGPMSASLRSDDGVEVDVPDFATDLRPDDPPQFRIDRRNHGFWVTPLTESVTLDGEKLSPHGAALRDGQCVAGSTTWVFRDPLESHVAKLEAEPAEVSSTPSVNHRRFDTIALTVGATAIVVAVLALLIIFDVA